MSNRPSLASKSSLKSRPSSAGAKRNVSFSAKAGEGDTRTSGASWTPRAPSLRGEMPRHYKDYGQVRENAEEESYLSYMYSSASQAFDSLTSPSAEDSSPSPDTRKGSPGRRRPRKQRGHGFRQIKLKSRPADTTTTKVNEDEGSGKAAERSGSRQSSKSSVDMAHSPSTMQRLGSFYNWVTEGDGQEDSGEGVGKAAERTGSRQSSKSSADMADSPSTMQRLTMQRLGSLYNWVTEGAGQEEGGEGDGKSVASDSGHSSSQQADSVYGWMTGGRKSPSQQFRNKVRAMQNINSLLTFKSGDNDLEEDVLSDISADDFSMFDWIHPARSPLSDWLSSSPTAGSTFNLFSDESSQMRKQWKPVLDRERLAARHLPNVDRKALQSGYKKALAEGADLISEYLEAHIHARRQRREIKVAEMNTDRFGEATTSMRMQQARKIEHEAFAGRDESRVLLQDARWAEARVENEMVKHVEKANKRMERLAQEVLKVYNKDKDAALSEALRSEESVSEEVLEAAERYDQYIMRLHDDRESIAANKKLAMAAEQREWSFVDQIVRAKQEAQGARGELIEAQALEEKTETEFEEYRMFREDIENDSLSQITTVEGLEEAAEDARKLAMSEQLEASSLEMLLQSEMRYCGYSEIENERLRREIKDLSRTNRDKGFVQ